MEIIEETEYDIFIHMPPVREWKARVKIKNIEKAKIRNISYNYE